jgi:hypothetical protein
LLDRSGEAVIEPDDGSLTRSCSTGLRVLAVIPKVLIVIDTERSDVGRYVVVAEGGRRLPEVADGAPIRSGSPVRALRV